MLSCFMIYYTFAPVYVFFASFGVTYCNCCAPACPTCRITPWPAPANQYAPSWCHRTVMTGLRKGWPSTPLPLFLLLPAMTQTQWTSAPNVESHQRAMWFKSDHFDPTTSTQKILDKTNAFVFTEVICVWVQKIK